MTQLQLDCLEDLRAAAAKFHTGFPIATLSTDVQTGLVSATYVKGETQVICPFAAEDVPQLVAVVFTR